MLPPTPVYRSMKEWNKEGYYVTKGEKSRTRRADGAFLFSELQVTPYRRNQVDGYGWTSPVDYDYEHMDYGPWSFED